MTAQGTESLHHHDESTAMVAAAPDRVFAFSDNPERLVSHMSKSSWRMGWGHMTTTVDGGLGQQVGLPYSNARSSSRHCAFSR